MFLSAPPKPTKHKHAAYLAATVLLGIVVSFAVHAGIEAAYLAWTESAGKTVAWYGGCALHPILQIALILGGALGGYALGRFWWRKVYVERVWARRKF